MASVPLTAKKAKWAKNRNVVLRGIPLMYNVSLQMRYEKAIRTLVLEMTRETKKQIAELFRDETAKDFIKQQKTAAAMDAKITPSAKKVLNALTKQFTDLFAKKSDDITERMLKDTLAASKSSLHASLEKLSGGLSLNTGVVPEGMEEISQAIINENVSLIKSIPQQYLKDVTGSVMRSITIGRGVASLLPEIEKYSGQASKRAKLIALDQTRKAYNSINKQRMQAVGVKQFEWLHSGGGQHPRRSHQAMSGNIYSFDDLPIINQEQVAKGYEPPERGIPGQAINCRCTMGPVINFGDE